MAVATTLGGTVTAGGDPLAGAYVRVLDPGGEFTGERRTGADGRFLFHLRAGSWRLVAMAAGDRRAELDVALAEGEDHSVEIPLGG